jgi:hypothetical protein
MISNTVYSTALFACLQTQAQRYMCVNSTKAAQKYNIELQIMMR